MPAQQCRARWPKGPKNPLVLVRVLLLALVLVLVRTLILRVFGGDKTKILTPDRLWSCWSTAVARTDH